MKRQIEGDKAFLTYIDGLLCGIEDEIEKYKDRKVYLFGVGKIGKILLEKLTSGERAVLIAGFAVSLKEGSPNFYMGYPVKQFDCIEDRKESVFILATTNPNYEHDMMELLKKEGIERYIRLNKGEADA